MFLSPLSEIPSIGRNLPYLTTLAIFVILQVPTVLVHNVAGFMILRFLAGFFGSPALATAGASIADMCVKSPLTVVLVRTITQSCALHRYSPKKRAYAIGVWGLAAVCGPVLGPLIGGEKQSRRRAKLLALYLFVLLPARLLSRRYPSHPRPVSPLLHPSPFPSPPSGFSSVNGWRWTIWPLLWLSGGVLLFLLFTLPETSATNILVRRAQRLRRVTGNDKLHSQGEVIQAQMTGQEIVMMTLVRPFTLTFREVSQRCSRLQQALPKVDVALLLCEIC